MEALGFGDNERDFNTVGGDLCEEIQGEVSAYGSPIRASSGAQKTAVAW